MLRGWTLKELEAGAERCLKTIVANQTSLYSKLGAPNHHLHSKSHQLPKLSKPSPLSEIPTISIHLSLDFLEVGIFFPRDDASTGC